MGKSIFFGFLCGVLFTLAGGMILQLNPIKLELEVAPIQVEVPINVEDLLGMGRTSELIQTIPMLVTDLILPLIERMELSVEEGEEDSRDPWRTRAIAEFEEQLNLVMEMAREAFLDGIRIHPPDSGP